MHNAYDQFAKQMIEQALAPTGQVTTDAEILADAQHVDVWYVPDPQLAYILDGLGLLGRMVMRGPRSFEPFHEAPSVAEVLDCLRKLLPMLLSAGGKERWRTSPDNPPMMWVIAAGRPDAALGALGMTPLPGWPTGIYAPATALQMRVVVIPELPTTRDTLLVRLMGAGRVLREAMEELRRLPDDAV